MPRTEERRGPPPRTGQTVGRWRDVSRRSNLPLLWNESVTPEDLRLEGQAGRLGSEITAVVTEEPAGKGYRLPTEKERRLVQEAEGKLADVLSGIPFGLPEEPLPRGARRAGGGSPFTVYLYGLVKWRDLFTPRQLLGLGTFVRHIQRV